MLVTLRKKLLAMGALLLLALAPAAFPVVVSAAEGDISEGLKCGSNLSLEGDDCDVEGGAGQVSSLLKRAIDILSIIVGIVAVIMIIVGGFKYITSGGDSGNISSAKNTIIYAIIGLVIVAFAQFLVQFVLGEALQ